MEVAPISTFSSVCGDDIFVLHGSLSESMVKPTVNVRKLMMRVDGRSRFYAIAHETQVSPQLMLRDEHFRVVLTDTGCVIHLLLIPFLLWMET